MSKHRTVDWVNTPTEREWLEWQEKQRNERINMALAAVFFPLVIIVMIAVCASTPMWMR